MSVPVRKMVRVDTAPAAQQKCNTHLTTGTSSQTFAQWTIERKANVTSWTNFFYSSFGQLSAWEVGTVFGMGYHASEEVASQLAYSISCSRECFRDLLCLSELHVVKGGGWWHPCQCHCKAFCGGVTFGLVRVGSDLLSSYVVESPRTEQLRRVQTTVGMGRELLLT